MYIYIRVCIYIYMYIYICTYIHTINTRYSLAVLLAEADGRPVRGLEPRYVYYVYACMYLCMHACMHACM